MTLIANVFPKLRTLKDLVRYISKMYHLRVPLDKENGKRAQTLLKSERRHVYHVYWSLWRMLSLIKSVLVICKVLRLFLNTLTADEKYSLANWVNLAQPIQMQLSQKQKMFLRFFSAALKPWLNFEHFQKKKTLIANVFPKFRTPRNVVR